MLQTRILGTVATLFSLIVSGCVAPRSISHSGRVTPAREFRPGIELNFNVGLAGAEVIADGLKGTVDGLANKSDNLYEDNVNTAAEAAVAHSLDPIFASGYGLSLRYGIIDRLDAGYKYANSAHVLDARFQFLGKPGERALSNKFGDGGSGLAGSVGLQFSSQSYELPSFAGLDKLQSLLGFEMKRKDLLVPVAFSYSLGADEKYGALSFGAVFGYTFLSYGFEPNNLVKDVNGVQELIEKVNRKQGYATFGGFAHIKVGYRYFYLGLGTAIYYQNFGEFDILDQVQFDLSGISIVPTINLETRF